MASGRRYYWMKLSEDFMSSDVVDYIMSLRDGAKVIVLYEQMCLMSINSGGKLSAKINGTDVPYDVARIQREAKFFPVSVVRSALNILRKVGLIEMDESGTISIPNISELVGSETDYAEKKRRQRGDRYGDNVGDNTGDNAGDNVPIDIRAKRSDLRDKSIEPRDKSTAGGGTPISERPDFGTLEAYASNNLRNLSPRNCEELISFGDDLPDDLIRHAIDEACAAGTPTWSYTRAILNRYVDSGFKTVGDAKAAEQKRRENRAKRGQTADGKPNPALDYEQHEHTESDFADLFLNLDDWEGGGTS